jgi:hypothetical protein
MVYPIFEINSIKTRCESDIEQFCSTFLKVKTGVADSIYKLWLHLSQRWKKSKLILI